MKKRFFAIVAAVLTPAATLLVWIYVCGGSGLGVLGVTSSGPLDARSSYVGYDRASTSSNGVSYYLDAFGHPSDFRNNFIAVRDVWCCDAGSNCSAAVCSGDNLLSVSFDPVTRLGDSGASLRLDYDVEQANSLASYYEALFSGDTFYDLSSFEEFHFWVKGQGDTISSSTRFHIRFADKSWHMAYVEIVGVSDEWEKKVIDIGSLSALDWTQMREVTFIFEHNRDGSGRYAHPLSGTLYFDDVAFWDGNVQVGSDDQFLDLLERRAFRYFWEYADPATGLIRDRATDSDLSSIAAVGFGLSAICVAEERGWITYDEAYTRVLTTLNSFYDDPSDPDDFVVSGTHGLFWHFVDIHDGTPMRPELDGVSTIDTALLMAGVLHCRQHFSGTEIMTVATKIYEAAEWDWFLDGDRGLMYMKWTPENGFEYHWGGYNEAMILYLLAIGSPTHPISATSWIPWTDPYTWGAYYGYPVLASPALFTHQYSHCWVDFRGKMDGYANYFRNSRYATLANRAYSRDVWYPDPVDLWGITSCDGPVEGTCSGWDYRGNIGYPPDTGHNDGTVAPTAAGGSIVFAPEYSISTLRYLYEHYHHRLWGLYGLKDALNATCEPDWFDNDYIGIDVGATLIMIENYRSNLVWDTFMQNQEITEAMEAVGFVQDDTQEPSYFYYREAEAYSSVSGTGVAVEDHATAWDQRTLQIGPDSGNAAVYTVHVNYDGDSSMLFGVRYSDDVAGNVIDVCLDGVKEGSFTTDKFGSWDSFEWDDEWVNLGVVTSGVHTITLRVAEGGGGSWGVNLDVFRIYTALDVAKQAHSDCAWRGIPLTYTLSVTNTSGMTLNATITDVLPSHVTPAGALTWTPLTIAPDGVWTEQVTVTVPMDRCGPLVNTLQVSTEEGIAATTVDVIDTCPRLYLPLLLRQIQ